MSGNPDIDALLRTITNLTPVLPAIAETIRSSIDKNFQAGGRTGDNGYGGGSKRWTPSLRAEKEGGQTLVDHAILASSINVQVSGSAITISSNLDYAAIQNFGGPAGRNHAVLLPARPFAVVQDEDLDEMIDIVVAYYDRS